MFRLVNWKTIERQVHGSMIREYNAQGDEDGRYTNYLLFSNKDDNYFSMYCWIIKWWWVDDKGDLALSPVSLA